jgi:hypothetical protein
MVFAVALTAAGCLDVVMLRSLVDCMDFDKGLCDL